MLSMAGPSWHSGCRAHLGRLPRPGTTKGFVLTCAEI